MILLCPVQGPWASSFFFLAVGAKSLYGALFLQFQYLYDSVPVNLFHLTSKIAADNQADHPTKACR